MWFRDKRLLIGISGSGRGAWPLVLGVLLGGCAYGPQAPVNQKIDGDPKAYESAITLETIEPIGEKMGDYPQQHCRTGTPPNAIETKETVQSCNEFAFRYEFDAWLQAHPKLPKTAIFVSLSGGGLRAATLAQSVLVALSQYRYCADEDETVEQCQVDIRSLADDIIVVSAASGGATTGTAFALGQMAEIDEGTSFAKTFLTSSLENNIYKVFEPTNWLDRTAPYRRAYSDFLKSSTFQDLSKNLKSPFLMLNSTDASSGRTFTFTQLAFSDICSDMMKLKLADAVDAAGNFPYIETAVTLHNFRADRECLSNHDSSETTRLKNYLKAPYGDLLYATAARYWLEMREANPDEEWRRDPNIPTDRLIQWIHLSDGGLADNLGLKPITDLLIRPRTLARLHNRGVERMAVIVVNARSDETKQQYHDPASPWLLENWHLDTENLMVETSYGPIDRVTALNEFMSFPLIDKTFFEGCKPGSTSRGKTAEKGELAPCSSGAVIPNLLFPIVIDFDQLSENIIVDDQGKLAEIPLPEIVALREHLKNISTQNQLKTGRGYVIPPNGDPSLFDDSKALKSAGRMLLARNPCFRALIKAIPKPDYQPRPGLEGIPASNEIWTAKWEVYSSPLIANDGNPRYAAETESSQRQAYLAECLPLEAERLHEFYFTRYPGTRERTLEEK